MKIRNLVLFFTTMLAFACSSNEETSQEGITISGSVGFPQENGVITIEAIGKEIFTPVDTIELKEDYTFSHQFIGETNFYRINFYGLQTVVMVLNDSDITVKVDGNNQNGFSEVSGSTELKFTKAINDYMASFQGSQAVKDLGEKYRVAQSAGDQEAIAGLRLEYAQLEKERNDSISNAILGAEVSLAHLQIIGILDKDAFFPTYEAVAKNLLEKYPNNIHVQDFNADIESNRKISIGNIAPEIELPNPEGEMIKLSSFRGNYVLVDFWAKWCKPCRMENPNVVKAYQKYNKDGFEVLGVSLDRTKEDWLKAIEEDGLTWTHISDLKFWKSAAARTYNVNSIPFALLLDPEGRIVAKNLRGAALENKLAEIYGH